MTQPTFWWLLAGGAVALELLTGTFYLLMLVSLTFYVRGLITPRVWRAIHKAYAKP